jgi:transcription-repair coupling factor (superfamily II helicase)
VVTDEEIFGRRRFVPRRRRASVERALAGVAQLEAGGHVVHVDHGVGIYRGLRHMRVAGAAGDFILIEYAGGDLYYLPVDRINLVERYTGGPGEPRLDRLGSPVWTRTKERARRSVMELAVELLDVEAFRSVHRRESFVEVDAGFEDFAAQFPFEETPGQQSAIDDVVADLETSKPMDRVVCGDVGYGKTEVAMRAAYLAAMGGKQVAFLVPTTVLARQHFDTLRRRFDGYPLRVAMLSRFNTAAENRRVIAGLADGGIDIVVGTHRLLQRDVSFSRLGLLVVDEEHRFGVRAKERVKRMRREIDILTMTATPIPRTLQLALSGVRDLSLIETPPVDRLAIRTYVAHEDDGLTRQAVSRELARGGQAFVVHNRVASIAMVARRVEELIPEARVAVAHGRMRERELETVMLDFLEQRSDVLVCTSIIESGLDIPNANTIVVHRADGFGLAQLYQIRGRVGRSHRRAYAYLLVPGADLITEDARRRLAVLRELDDLGSGFRVAAHDMEIRGAGNLLGREQSGQIAAVGFDLFMRMLEEAAAELGGRPHLAAVEPEVELGGDAFIPEEYIEDVGERLMVYKRLAGAANAGSVEAMGEELADRFGALPPEVDDVLRVMALRPTLKSLGVESLKAAASGANFAVAARFHGSSSVAPERLAGLVAESPESFALRPDGTLVVRMDKEDWRAMVDELAVILGGLAAGLGLEQAAREN